MVTQEVELPLSPTALVTRCADLPGVFVLDGGDLRSWGTGEAIFGFAPRATLRVSASGEACMDDGEPRQWRGEPLDLLERFRAHGAALAQASPQGGAVVAALSYDLGRWLEPLRPARPDHTLPVLYAAFYDSLLRYSYADRHYRLSSARGPAELAAIASELQARARLPSPLSHETVPGRVAVADWAKEEYLTALGAVLDYIAAGDVYQINLAQRFVVYDPPPPAALFEALQRHTVPFGAYVDAGDFVLLSNSPECLLALHGNKLATFPIKGTRPRGADPDADRERIRDLVQSPKEQAEHLMIVDLERNDLGRICRTGSVRVRRLASVETFPTLHHLVSHIEGQLWPGTTLAQVLRALFPGGSITGAPKVRAMQIIDELEPVSRQFYTGAIGYVGLDGRAVFNLAIRTAIATADQLAYYAGGGIVADSVPSAEYEETLLKTGPFFTASSAVLRS